MTWRVKPSNCFPMNWKVYPTSKYQETNDPENYFTTLSVALNETVKRNIDENDPNRTNEYPTIEVD
jgi:hypothetical protein